MQLQKISHEMENRTACDIIRWAIDTYGLRVGLASSFGAEDVVIIDLMTHINKTKTKVFTLDTGRLNQETYDIMDQVRKRYDISIEVYFPYQNEVEEMRSEEHTSELQSHVNLVCRLLLEKKKK